MARVPRPHPHPRRRFDLALRALIATAERHATTIGTEQRLLADALDQQREAILERVRKATRRAAGKTT